MAKEKRVKFVRLWFTDILGFLKSFAITIRELEGALGEDLFYKFIGNKKIEWDRYRAQVTDYELSEYFSIL